MVEREIALRVDKLALKQQIEVSIVYTLAIILEPQDFFTISPKY